jgi:hypothetical protein
LGEKKSSKKKSSNDTHDSDGRFNGPTGFAPELRIPILNPDSKPVHLPYEQNQSNPANALPQATFMNITQGVDAPGNQLKTFCVLFTDLLLFSLY